MFTDVEAELLWGFFEIDVEQGTANAITLWTANVRSEQLLFRSLNLNFQGCIREQESDESHLVIWYKGLECIDEL